jgi:hypothetical protein
MIKTLLRFLCSFPKIVVLDLRILEVIAIFFYFFNDFNVIAFSIVIVLSMSECGFSSLVDC